MHAIVIHANIHDPAEARRGLDEEVIPMIKKARGFVGAYFVALDDGQGVSIEVFETEAQAKAAAPPEGTGAPGVTLDTLQFGEVLGAG
jgi:microsomal dipeptidase-like Zn-dependent dipeptidase